MPRSLRLVAVSTALLVAATAATALPISAVAVDAPGAAPAGSISAPLGDDVAAPAAPAVSGKAIAQHWPVRYRYSVATQRSAPPMTSPARQIVSAKALADRLTGELVVDAVLGGTPTEATNARFSIGFGTIVDDLCQSPEGAYTSVTTYGAGAAYQRGDRLRFSVSLPAMRTDAGTCVLALVTPLDESVSGYYDQVVNRVVTEVRERPRLRITFPGKRLEPGRFTRVPIRITNLSSTIATAPGVRLVIKRHGPMRLRWRKLVGTIRPGASRTVVVRVDKRDARYLTATFSARSRDYRFSVLVPITTRL